MSPFEEVFGEGANTSDENLSDLIAVIRDRFEKPINHYIPESSMASSPGCILYAIFKLLENDLQQNKEFKSYEEIHFWTKES